MTLRFIDNPDGSFNVIDVPESESDELIPSQEIKCVDTHEFIFFADGRLTIEDINFQENLDMNLDHVVLDIATTRKLRDFLCSPRMTELLAE